MSAPKVSVDKRETLKFRITTILKSDPLGIPITGFWNQYKKKYQKLPRKGRIKFAYSLHVVSPYF